MSFFADMLAGGAVGLGTGMAAQYQSDQQERIRQEALDEKRALAMQLQQQRSEDLRYRVDQDAQNKADRLAMMGGAGSGGTGSGGGKAGGMNLMQMALQAKTPEEADKVIRLAETFGGEDGKDASALLADKFFNTPKMDAGKNYSSDPRVTVDDEGNSTTGPATRVAYDTNKGARALQSVVALAMDPSKMDDVVKGQRGSMLLDEADAAGNSVKNPIERATLKQSLSNPTSTQAALDSKDYAADSRLEAAAKRSSGGVAKGASTEKLTTQRNSIMSTIKSMEGSMGRSALAKDTRYQTALQDVAEIDQLLREKRGASPALAPPDQPANRPPLNSFFKK